MTHPADTLAAQAAALAQTPSDLGSWLALAATLDAVERAAEAKAAWDGLGTAASELGQVALAVACAVRLRESGDHAAARALLARIAATHCAGSPRIDGSARPRPPAPPRAALPPDPSPPVVDLDDAVGRAVAAVELAVAAAAERAGERLPPTPLVSGLGPAELDELVGASRLARRSAGELLLDVGHEAQTLYWLARGAVRITRGDTELGELRGGSFFGEIALLAGTTRTARVTCTTDAWMLEIPARALEVAAARTPHLAGVLAEYARARLLANLMRTSALFSRLDDDERRLLLGRFRAGILQVGDSLLEEGADTEELHVLVSGRCELRSGDAVLATLGVGDGFGESSLLRRAPAAADVVAVEPTVTLSLSRGDFDDIAVKHPELLAEVYKLLVERERDSPHLIHDASDLII